MKMRLILMLAVLAVTLPSGSRRALAATQAGDKAAAAQPFDMRTVLPVCERALQAALDGHSGAAVLEDGFKALPADEKQAALGVCQVYALGAVSMLKHMSEAPTVPAGAGLSI